MCVIDRDTRWLLAVRAEYAGPGSGQFVSSPPMSSLVRLVIGATQASREPGPSTGSS